MAKVIKFDDTIEYKIDRANDLYADENFADALTLLFEVVKRDEKNKDALILIGRIYADMNAFNESNVAYMTAYAKTKSKDAIKGIISNALVNGKFRLAKYYKDTYGVDYDFSEFLTVQTEDGETLFPDDEEERELERHLRLVVSRKEKGGENLVKEKDLKNLKNLTINDLEGLGGNPDFMKFSELMEKLLNFDDGEEDDKPEKRRTEIGFKQVYPRPSAECEQIISDAFKLFSTGKPQESLDLLKNINEKNGKYYYIAEKNKAMCYLALDRLQSMKIAAETALKGLPDDFSLKCYYYIALKLLDEKTDAEKVFSEIKTEKPKNTMEYMVKLDACRLALDHEGVLDAVENVLPDFPYQPQFLILYGKAQYNCGYIKPARATFLEIVRLYPDNFEARLLLDKINDGEDSLIPYGDMEVMLKRVRILSDLKMKMQDNIGFMNYLKYDKDAYRNIEYVLLNENEQNVYVLMTGLTTYVSKQMFDMYEKLLISPYASPYLKTLALTVYLSDAMPGEVAVANIDEKLKIVKMADYGWEKGINDVVKAAAYFAFSQVIMREQKPKSAVDALSERLKRISGFLMSELSPKDIVKELNSIDSMVAMKDALCDLSTHRVRRSTPMTVIDEKYLRYVELLKEVDEKYEI